jgi:hypothetical protein
MAGLSAGRLVDLADHAHLLAVELELAGFDEAANLVACLARTIEGDAGARAVQELRATSNGTDAAPGDLVWFPSVPDEVSLGYRLADDLALRSDGAPIREHREAA